MRCWDEGEIDALFSALVPHRYARLENDGRL